MNFEDSLVKSTQKSKLSQFAEDYKKVSEFLNDAFENKISPAVVREFQKGQVNKIHEIHNKSTDDLKSKMKHNIGVGLGGVMFAAFVAAGFDKATDPNAPYFAGLMCTAVASGIAAMGFLSKEKVNGMDAQMMNVMHSTYMDMKQLTDKFSDGGEITDEQIQEMCSSIIKHSDHIRSGVQVLASKFDVMESVTQKYSTYKM